MVGAGDHRHGDVVRSRPLVLTLPLLLGACTQHDPEPLGKTVPVAAMLAAVAIIGCAHAVRWGRRRWRRHADAQASAARFPRTAATLLWVPLAPVAAIVVLALTEVAIGYRNGKYDALSWDDTLLLSTIAIGILLLLAHLVAALASRLASPQPAVHARTLIGIGVVVLATGSLSGVGLVWLPALLTAFPRRRPDARTAEPPIDDAEQTAPRAGDPNHASAHQ